MFHPLPRAGTPPLGQVPAGLVQIGLGHLFWAENWQAGGVWVLGVGTSFIQNWAFSLQGRQSQQLCTISEPVELWEFSL